MPEKQEGPKKPFVPGGNPSAGHLANIFKQGVPMQLKPTKVHVLPATCVVNIHVLCVYCECIGKLYYMYM